MSFNSTAPAAGYVAALVDVMQQYVSASPGRAVMLALFFMPALIVVLNIFKQLVSI
jgi:sterol 14-demethylase